MPPNLNDWYTKNNITPPETIAHNLTVDDISKKLEQVHIKGWRQEGNMLIAETDIGDVGNPIATNLILTGTDAKGLPTFKKI